MQRSPSLALGAGAGPFLASFTSCREATALRC